VTVPVKLRSGWADPFVKVESRVLWLVILLLSVRADVSSSVTKHSSLYSELKKFSVLIFYFVAYFS
jgi:hypothetical protein